MKCDVCNGEEILEKKRLTGRCDVSGNVITHHECPQAHTWHIVVADNDTKVLECDCAELGHSS